MTCLGPKNCEVDGLLAALLLPLSTLLHVRRHFHAEVLRHRTPILLVSRHKDNEVVALLIQASTSARNEEEAKCVVATLNFGLLSSQQGIRQPNNRVEICLDSPVRTRLPQQ